MFNEKIIDKLTKIRGSPSRTKTINPKEKPAGTTGKKNNML